MNFLLWRVGSCQMGVVSAGVRMLRDKLPAGGVRSCPMELQVLQGGCHELKSLFPRTGYCEMIYCRCWRAKSGASSCCWLFSAALIHDGSLVRLLDASPLILDGEGERQLSVKHHQCRGQAGKDATSSDSSFCP